MLKAELSSAVDFIIFTSFENYQSQTALAIGVLRSIQTHMMEYRIRLLLSMYCTGNVGAHLTFIYLLTLLTQAMNK